MNKIITLLLASFGLIANSYSHAVQVGYCFNCNGDLRIWIEHWHGNETIANTNMTLTLNVNGVTSTQSGQALTNIQNVPAANLPGCTTPISIFGSCPGQANTYNDWVNYDFPGMPSGVPITITVN